MKTGKDPPSPNAPQVTILLFFCHMIAKYAAAIKETAIYKLDDIVFPHNSACLIF